MLQDIQIASAIQSLKDNVNVREILLDLYRIHLDSVFFIYVPRVSSTKTESVCEDERHIVSVMIRNGLLEQVGYILLHDVNPDICV